jgi:tetratricopeptide (TPR) repeat protein
MTYVRIQCALLCTAILALPSISALAQTRYGKAKPHWPGEMMKLIEASKLSYTIGVLKEKVPPEPAGPVLDPDLWLKRDGKRVTVERYILSPPAASHLNKAERAFQANQHDQAMRLYKAVQKSVPNYGHVHVLVGDVHFKKGEFREAKVAYRRAIQMNAIDYQAHWFLADTLWRMGDRPRAVQEITIAHLLNVNHSKMKQVLRRYRTEMGRPWKDWEFNPQYRVSAKGTKVSVQADPNWLGYALVKAYWKYEPGYAERMAGADYRKQAVCDTEEREAIVSLVAGSKVHTVLKKIIADGFFDEMLLYEIAGKRCPSMIPLLSNREISRIVTYLERYH